MDRRSVLAGLAGSLALGFKPWPAGAATGGRAPVGYIRTNWSQDPFAYGSYSYLARGVRRGDVRALEKPLGNQIFFAGEAVFPAHNSTVHAAYESGQRTAEALIEAAVQSVAIIGAGMSGLSAAHALAAAGLEVTVYEARDRIGGRVWTDTRLDVPLDLGASWIHGINGNPVLRLAAEAGAEWVKTGDRYVIRGRDGRLIDDRAAPQWLKEVVSIQHEAGADREQIDALAYLLRDDYDGDDVTFPGGYADVFKALDGPYTVHLGHVVTRLTREGTRVVVGFDRQGGAATKAFDAALVTVPLGVLKRGAIQFEPDLPARKRGAIQRIGMGTLDKVFLLYDEAFWDRDIAWIATPENDLPQGQFNQWLI
ncbi:MAG: FAD-dependent oxidoreductase, partial [Pseudomonadota bacterium]